MPRKERISLSWRLMENEKTKIEDVMELEENKKVIEKKSTELIG